MEYYRGQRIRDERTGKVYRYRGRLGSDTILLADPRAPYAAPKRASRTKDRLRPVAP